MRTTSTPYNRRDFDCPSLRSHSYIHTFFHHYIIPILLFLFSFSAEADTHYVNKANLTPQPGYTNGWASAATNIQDAIDQAVGGDLILVTNGVYNTGGRLASTMTNRVVLTNSVTVRAVSTNPADTLIVGAPDPVSANGPASIRCAYVATNCILAGFTLTNGYSGSDAANENGGGVLCGSRLGFASAPSTVSNCHIVSCRALSGGGGSYLGLLVDCQIRNNTSGNGSGCRDSSAINSLFSGNVATSSYSGCVFMFYGAMFSNCIIANNNGASFGGGFCANGVVSQTGRFYNCSFISNRAAYGAGFRGSSDTLMLYNCVFRGNEASIQGSAVSGTALLQNCLIVDNFSTNATSNGGAALVGASLQNCTIVANSTARAGFGAIRNCFATNCIIYGNQNNDAYDLSEESNCFYSCIGSNGASADHVSGNSNIYNVVPQFVNMNAGDYRLRNISPCVNSGTNMDSMTNAMDLGGLRRIIDGVVDMGAYEYLPRGTVISTFGTP